MELAGAPTAAAAPAAAAQRVLLPTINPAALPTAALALALALAPSPATLSLALAFGSSPTLALAPSRAPTSSRVCATIHLFAQVPVPPFWQLLPPVLSQPPDQGRPQPRVVQACCPQGSL